MSRNSDDSSKPLVLFDRRPALQALAHSCASCGDTGCFRHKELPRSPHSSGLCGWIVDEAWPEWGTLAASWEQEKVLLTPRPELWAGGGWQQVSGAPLCSLQRSLRTRFVSNANVGGSVWKEQLKSSERLAQVLGKRLSSEVGHVVVAQSLLPFLWQSGVLGGRTFDVLMTRMPLDELARQLDGAFEILGDSTLADFRAPSALVRAEREALDEARMIYSPHEQIRGMLGGRGQRLEWEMPTVSSFGSGDGDALIVAGSALARKGAYAVRDVARELGVPLIIVGRDWMDAGFWEGVEVRKLEPGESWLGHARVAVLPALVEHAPRPLLLALSAGIPVIASRECGLGEREGVTTVPFGDCEALIRAVRVFF